MKKDAAATGIARDWNGAAAIIASLVGLLALCVSGYTAWLQHQQISAQVWPYLEPAVSSSRYAAEIVNKGTGPAIVHAVRVSVDGKLRHSWDDVFAALDLGRAPPSSTVSGVVVAAGERIKQLAFADDDAFVAFMKQYSRIAMKICYCSTLDDCWELDQSVDGAPSQRRAVDECAAPQADDLNDNGAR